MPLFTSENKVSATFLPTDPTETSENYAGQKIKCVGKHFPCLWAYMPVSLAIQENAQDAVVELSGHGMVIHGKQQSRKL
jgi:hypothetical protein